MEGFHVKSSVGPSHEGRRNLLRKFARRTSRAHCQLAVPVQYLPALGVYGFGEIEPVILAALVTGDPLLLIGASGTGKTYLLNSLSEALNLEHRHYNASLISFDDLVGFPYPDPEGRACGFSKRRPPCGARNRS